jgi:hypothetical protein
MSSKVRNVDKKDRKGWKRTSVLSPGTFRMRKQRRTRTVWNQCTKRRTRGSNHVAIASVHRMLLMAAALQRRTAVALHSAPKSQYRDQLNSLCLSKMDKKTPAKAAQTEALLGRLSLNTTESTAKTGDSPDSKDGDESLLMHDPGYIPPSQQDMLLLDITGEFLHNELSDLFEADYLSDLSKEEELERYMETTVNGAIVGNNKRFMISVPCRRRNSEHNRPTSPKAALPFVNMFFLVDTGSPHSYLCPEAMAALGGGRDSHIPSAMVVELLTGTMIEMHVSPRTFHFSNVNVLGGNVMNVANLVSDPFRNEFLLLFRTDLHEIIDSSKIMAAG